MSTIAATCYLVEKSSDLGIHSSLSSTNLPEIQDGEVLIEVSHSSLNYKDAMAAQGHPGIVKNFPHVPGIDSVGVVQETRDSRYRVGDLVIATGHELGVERWGGWSSHLICPGDWLVPLPDGLTAIEAMTLGTAGFTAAQCVDAVLRHECKPDDGKVIVSGATGGVGSLSVMLLAKIGFEVVAVTGKQDRHDWLRELGASEILGRGALAESKRPLLSGEYAAGIDTVGGTVLATMLKKIVHRGCVACCGVAGGGELPTTVYPFILRGIALYGIDSAWCPDGLRRIFWETLANEWKLEGLEKIRVDLQLTQIDRSLKEILAGKFAGRGVIRIGNESSACRPKL